MLAWAKGAKSTGAGEGRGITTLTDDSTVVTGGFTAQPHSDLANQTRQS